MEPWQALGLPTTAFFSSSFSPHTPACHANGHTRLSRPWPLTPLCCSKPLPFPHTVTWKLSCYEGGPPGNSRAILMWQIAPEFQDNSLLSSVSVSNPLLRRQTLTSPPWQTPTLYEPPSGCAQALAYAADSFSFSPLPFSLPTHLPPFSSPTLHPSSPGQPHNGSWMTQLSLMKWKTRESSKSLQRDELTLTVPVFLSSNAFPSTRRGLVVQGGSCFDK